MTNKPPPTSSSNAKFDYLFTIIERLLILALAIKFFIGIDFSDLSQGNSAGLILSILKFLIIVLLVLVNRPAKNVRLNWQTFLGLILSFGGFFILSTPPTDLALSPLALVFGSATVGLYLVLLLTSYINLGRSLGLVPALRKVISKGMYDVVRHPIYACYLHIVATYSILFPNIQNIVAIIVIAIGFRLRAIEEEVVLSQDESYRKYLGTVKSRFFSVYLSTPLIILLGITVFPKNQSISSSQEILKVQLAYPVTSLDPTIYDDWSSVFVANHIFPSLVGDAGGDTYSLSKEINIECTDQNESTCMKKRIYFATKNFSMCNGEPLLVDQIKMELQTILNKKDWILPGWQVCSNESKLCVEGPNLPDLKRRLQNIYFRFGWSQINFDQDQTIGVHPYCLTNIARTNGSISGGQLKAPENGFPPLTFFVSQKSDDDFDIAIYGTQELLNGKRANVHANTPLAYYVVTHPDYEEHSAPWNTVAVRDLIRKHLQSNDFIYQIDDPLKSIVPLGSNFSHSPKKSINKKVFLALPTYFPKCSELETSLNKMWKDSIYVSAKCVELIQYANETLFGSKKWAGVLIPLSSGAPFRTSIFDQYFSGNSKESFIRGAKRPSDSFYLVGLGKTLITINKSRICNHKSNALGVSNVKITDFELCK